MEQPINFMEAMIQASASSTKVRELDRQEYLIKEGMIEQNIYLVEEGALRIFIMSEFEEHTIRFGYKGSWITSLASFLKRTPSEFYIQAIRKSVVSVIPKRCLHDFIDEDPHRLKQYIMLLEDLVHQQIEREIDLLTYSPAERLKKVLERSPHLFQEIPAKYIASYLRMTPETLSRISKS